MSKRITYSAVVETGSHSADYSQPVCYEERRNCGHAHRTVEAAEACGAKHYASYTIHDQDGHRVER